MLAAVSAAVMNTTGPVPPAKVGARMTGERIAHGFIKGFELSTNESKGRFRVPIYKLVIGKVGGTGRWDDLTDVAEFPVIRFGVQYYSQLFSAGKKFTEC